MYAHVLVSDILTVLTCLEKGSPFYCLDVSSNVFSLMSLFVILAVVLVNSNALNIESTVSDQDWFFSKGKGKTKI